MRHYLINCENKLLYVDVIILVVNLFVFNNFFIYVWVWTALIMLVGPLSYAHLLIQDFFCKFECITWEDLLPQILDALQHICHIINCCLVNMAFWIFKLFFLNINYSYIERVLEQNKKFPYHKLHTNIWSCFLIDENIIELEFADEW